VELIAGINQIVVTAISDNQKKIQEKLTVVFSSEFAKDIASNDQEQATDEADAVREKVREKVENLFQNPKAYIGSVTDKNQDSLQIKNVDGEIQLISVDTQTTSFVKITKTQSSIKYTDIAIGDYIVAMGFAADATLTSKRILITQPPATANREIISGTIADIQKNSLSLNSNDAIAWDLSFPKSWKGPDIKELSIGDILIAVGEAKDSTLTIRTIAIMQKSVPSASASPTP